MKEDYIVGHVDTQSHSPALVKNAKKNHKMDNKQEATREKYGKNCANDRDRKIQKHKNHF